jgi:hypothetical protein
MKAFINESGLSWQYGNLKGVEKPRELPKSQLVLRYAK